VLAVECSPKPNRGCRAPCTQAGASAAASIEEVVMSEMNKVNERDSKSGRTPAGTKPEDPKHTDQKNDEWPPSGGPAERSDKDAIGRPVQLDED
jgi:hypothetical protein